MKTKIKLVTIISIFFFLIQSCIPSLHPLYTSKDLIFDQNLIGEWTDSDSIVWNFEKFVPSNNPLSRKSDLSKKSFYKLTVNDGKPAVFHVHLLKLEKYFYLDFYIKGYKIENDMADLHLFPVHTFAKVNIKDDIVKLEQFDIDFIKTLIKEKKIKIKHEVSYDNLILTAGTKELQKFVTKYAENKDLYTEDPIILKREI